MHHIPAIFRLVLIRRTPLLSAVCAIGVSLLGGGVLRAAMVRFYESTEVTASVVTLGDVADIRDTDPERVARLENITLMPAPSAGNSERIDFATIRSRLQAQGVNLAQIEFSGKSVIRVTASGKKDTSSGKRRRSDSAASTSQTRRAERRLKELIGRHIGGKTSAPERFDVVVQVPPEHVTAILAADPSRLAIEGGEPPWNESQTFLVRLPGGQGARPRVEVIARVVSHPRVPALRHAVPRGHVLKQDDLALRQVEDAQGAVTRMEDVLGRETKRTLRRGDTIAPDDIREVPLVRSGDIVTVYARRGGVVVRRQLKARDDGARGDMVKLVTLSGRERVLARVTGFHEAEVIGAEGPSAVNRNDEAGRIRFVPGE